MILFLSIDRKVDWIWPPSRYESALNLHLQARAVNDVTRWMQTDF
jgi:hypothetical protein